VDTKGANHVLTPSLAFPRVEEAHDAEAGVLVSESIHLQLVSVLARRGKTSQLTKLARDHYNIELPRTPRRACSSGIAFSATAPGGWLATHENGAGGFATHLTDTLGDAASICDQSSGYAVLRLTGPSVRDALCKLLPIDLHDRSFAINDVALTAAAHIGVTIWRLGDAAENIPVFELAVMRSYAQSWWDSLSWSAAEFGIARTVA
jgi:methylglutamate dehydrogenase subunit D